MGVMLLAADFKRGMLAAKDSVIGPNDGREMLKYVLVRAHHNGNAEIVALDGYTMVVSYAPCSVHGDDVNDAVGYTDYLIAPLAVPAHAFTVNISKNGAQIVLDFSIDGSKDNIVITQTGVTGDYIDFYRVMMTYPPTFSITVDPKYLARIAKACKSEKSVTICFYDPLKPIQIDGDHTRAILLPVRMGERDSATRGDIIRYRRESHE